MGAAENRAKSSAMAAHMKALGITRTTSQCPWGCGASVRNGGTALLNHLNACRGGGAKKLAAMNARRPAPHVRGLTQTNRAGGNRRGP